ncbi:amino acid adenylation domain-containing protein [Streptomyces sp. NPDC055709]
MNTQEPLDVTHNRRRDEASFDYWKQVLTDVSGHLQLPYDASKVVGTTIRGARVEVDLPDNVRSCLANLAAKIGVDPSTVVLAVWQHLLHRYSTEETILVGVPARPNTVAADAVGYFSNVLPIRSDRASHATLRQQVEHAAEQLAEACGHAHVDFAEIAKCSSRGIAATDLVEVSFVPHIAGAETFNLPGVRTSLVPHDPRRALFKLGLTVAEYSDRQARMTLDYRTDLWEVSTIQRMAGHLLTLLSSAVFQPDSPLDGFSMLTEAETHELMNLDQCQLVPPPQPTLHQAICIQAQTSPYARAMECEGRHLTYEQMYAWAGEVTGALQARGVRRRDRVAVFLERTERFPVAALAVVQAGAAYVPIDPRWPSHRINFVLEDSNCAAVVTEPELRGSLPPYQGEVIEVSAERDGGQTSSFAEVSVDADDPAYVIYTSGSTGRPNGVEVTHHNLMRLFSTTDSLFEFTASDRWTMFHSVAFDFSVWEMWGALTHGGCLVVVPYLITRNPDAFRKLLATEGITVLNQTPSAFAMLCDADARVDLPQTLRYVIFGGEALRFADLIQWAQRYGDSRPQLINMYGITETTVHVSFRRVFMEDIRHEDRSLIGKPLPDLECLITDQEGNLVPYGVPGELLVAGPGLAKGYIGNPELTDRRYIPHPFRGGERAYRSGDGAKRIANGEIEYLGRLDNQVQVRGVRIELGEIDSVMTRVLPISSCHAAVREVGGEPRIVTYVISPDKTASLSLPDVRRALAPYLPEYMLPSAVIVLESFPLTANGKIDRSVLPLPAPPVDSQPVTSIVAESDDTTQRSRASERMIEVPPQLELEKIQGYFAEACGLSRVDPTANFFEIGGDSMRAVQLSALAQSAGLDITIQDIFVQQTPEKLAASIGAKRPDRSLADCESMEETIPEDETSPNIEDVYPLSGLQVGMLLHSLRDGVRIYHDVFNYTVQARWNEQCFRKALDGVTEKYPTLRSTFDLTASPEPLQFVHKSATIPLTVVDLRAASEDDQQEAVSVWMSTEAASQINWTVHPPIHLVVHLLDDGLFELGFSFHHALMDGRSLVTLRTELLNSYNLLLEGRNLPTEVSPGNGVREFIVLEQAAQKEGASRNFWKEHLQEFEPRLFIDRKEHSGQVHTVRHQFSSEVLSTLQQVAAKRRVPLKNVLLAAHLVVNGRLARHGDVATGLVCNSRPETKQGHEAIGMFLNTVPLRITMSEDHGAVIDQSFAAEIALMPHRRVTLRTIHRDLGVERIFDTAFNFVDLDSITPDSKAKSQILRHKLIERTNIPLVTVFAKENETLTMGIEFAPECVSWSQIEGIIRAYEEEINSICNGGIAGLPDFDAESELSMLKAAPDDLGGLLRHIWQDVLQHPVSATDSMQSLAGDSIHSLVLSERIAQAFDCDPPLQYLLSGATLADMENALTSLTIPGRN